jgi:hypothetical protein
MSLLDDGDKIASIVGAVAGVGSLIVATISFKRSKECACQGEGAGPKTGFWSFKNFRFKSLPFIATLKVITAVVVWLFFLLLAVTPIIFHLYGWL